MKKVLITVCGRAGSKGFRNKNLKVFCGQPLVYYTLSAAALFAAARPDLAVDVALNTDSPELQRLVADHQVKDKVELAGQFCMGNCQNGVCVTVDGEQFSLKPESTKQFFEEQIVPRIS